MPDSESKPANLVNLFPAPVVADLSNKIKHTLPTRMPTEFDHERAQPKYEAHIYNSAPLDSQDGRMHKDARAGANFDEKIYMMPESYNALRIELHDNWPNLWQLVGGPMAFDAVRFIEMMDDALDTKTTFDSAKVDGICKKYLDLLRALRGLAPLHTASEKA